MTKYYIVTWLFAILTMSSDHPLDAQASDPLRVTVNPGQKQSLQARLSALRSEQATLQYSMIEEYDRFLRARTLEERWITHCNDRTAAELALWIGNKAWEEVASKHAPPVVRGALNIENWIKFVQVVFGQPPDLFKIGMNNLECRAKLTKAYLAKYSRLSSMGDRAKQIREEISDIERQLDEQRPSFFAILSGLWRGTMTCGGTPIGVDVSLAVADSKQLSGLMAIYPVQGSPRVQMSCEPVRGTVNPTTGQMSITVLPRAANSHIQGRQFTVSFIGKVNASRWAGRVAYHPAARCTIFSLEQSLHTPFSRPRCAGN
jgi:hypothetical protein